MAIIRDLLQGSPYTYCIHMQTALGARLFDEEHMQLAFLDLLELMQRVYHCGILFWRMDSDHYWLGVRLPHLSPEMTISFGNTGPFWQPHLSPSSGFANDSATSAFMQTLTNDSAIVTTNNMAVVAKFGLVDFAAAF